VIQIEAIQDNKKKIDLANAVKLGFLYSSLKDGFISLKL